MKNLNSKLKSILVGSLLGDSYLTKSTKTHKNPEFCFQHACKQLEYMEWKLSRFYDLGITGKIYNVDHNGFCSRRATVKVPTDIKLHYRHQFYPNGNKTITRHLLNQLDAEGLAIWFMDDGSMTYNKKNGRICSRYTTIATHGFTLEENQLISKYFSVVWGVNPTIRSYAKKGREIKYWLKFGAQETKKLVEIISPYMHNSMLYKIDFKYTNDLRDKEIPIKRNVIQSKLQK